MCPGTMQRFVGSYLATLLGDIFFRSLDHKWDAAPVESRGERQCECCGQWQHWTSVQQQYPNYPAQYFTGRHPGGACV